MSRIRNLLEAEGRRVDCPKCGKLVYGFGPIDAFTNGPRTFSGSPPRFYDASGLPHECEMERVSPLVKK